MHRSMASTRLFKRGGHASLWIMRLFVKRCSRCLRGRARARTGFAVRSLKPTGADPIRTRASQPNRCSEISARVHSLILFNDLGRTPGRFPCQPVTRVEKVSFPIVRPSFKRQNPVAHGGEQACHKANATRHKQDDKASRPLRCA